jgi:hypothetical protein
LHIALLKAARHRSTATHAMPIKSKEEEVSRTISLFFFFFLEKIFNRFRLQLQKAKHMEGDKSEAVITNEAKALPHICGGQGRRRTTHIFIARRGARETRMGTGEHGKIILFRLSSVNSLQFSRFRALLFPANPITAQIHFVVTKGRSGAAHILGVRAAHKGKEGRWCRSFSIGKSFYHFYSTTVMRYTDPAPPPA